MLMHKYIWDLLLDELNMQLSWLMFEFFLNIHSFNNEKKNIIYNIPDPGEATQKNKKQITLFEN